ncbi:hypothetical protein AB0H00_27745 [Nocardia sp. NPDC023852]|uniref:zinc finger domain-containing protein n=1 Tax=Nocardia sp. NPDC023852 TaxID=3154697 RepID=UPI00340E5D13
MELTPEQAAAVEHHRCPNCDAPAGSACRTRSNEIAAKYHTPRFVLVSALREELDVEKGRAKGKVVVKVKWRLIPVYPS